ncbi:MAG: transcription elongation factor GreA [Anaerolineae bacterium]|nr:MAG: transcription elongation factor GreA [Anaerolineae bacterium]
MSRNEQVYLTPEREQEMRTELADMKGRQREELSERLRFAISQGDLSENADYHKAKEDQAFLEGKILEYEMILSEALIIDANAKQTGVINIGSHVTVKEGVHPEETYHLVGAVEANPREGKISNESPLGKALLGHRVGEEIIYKSPGGEMKMKIVKVE